MDRRAFLAYCVTAGAALGVTGISGCTRVAPEISPADRAQLSGLQIADAHAHPYHLYGSKTYDPTTPTVEMMRGIGMRVSAFSAVGDLTKYPDASGTPYRDTQDQLRQVRRLADDKQVPVMRKAADLQAIGARPGSLGALMAIEGGDALEGDIKHVDRFYEAGVRLITVLHAHNNEIGVHQGSPADGPLTPFGVRVLERMNTLGIVVDVAHAKTATLKGIVEVSAAPVVDSHTGLLPTRATPPRPTRLRTWAEMELIAKTGGLICTWPMAYVANQYHRTTVTQWAEEIRRMKTQLGIEHCGLGTDGGGNLPRTVEGWDSIASLPNLIRAMREVGLSQEDIVAYTGGNFLRILARCTG
jgi:membrane dipeptidase